MSDLPLFIRKADERIAALEAALKTVSDYTGRLEYKLAAEQEKVRVLEGLLIDLNTVWSKSRYNRSKKYGSPNHAHAIPGVWDSDNGALAGKPCAECAVYDRAREIVAAIQATAQEEKNG